MLCSVCHLLNGTADQAHSTVEPSLPRKKKHPELAYRTRELLFDYEEGESSDSQEIVTGSHLEPDSRARSEEKNAGKSRASPRSRSADSSISRKTRDTAIADENANPSGATREEAERKGDEKEPLMAPSRANPGTPVAGGEGMPKTTEYRSQFVAWKRLQQEEAGVSPTARKSASMGLIASPAAARKDAVDGEAEGGKVEDEPDEDSAALEAVKRGKIKKTEYKAKFRPFSAYTYVDGNWKKSTRLIKDNEMPPDVDANTWYSEVVERLKKADQYKVRSHGGMPFYGPSEPLPPELLSHVRERCILSPVSLSSSSRTWKDDKLVKERARPALVPVHHPRKEKKEPTDVPDQPKGSPKKKPAVEKTTVRPKSAEPVIPAGKGENKSPKRTRPRAPKDLPVHGHGDLSGRKKASKQGISSPHGKGSPMESKPRPVPRPYTALVNGDDGKVWLKPAPKSDEGDKKPGEEGDTMVNGYPEESEKHDRNLVNGVTEEPDSVQPDDSKVNGHAEPSVPAAVTKPPMRVPLTTVKSPEEVTGVRSPDPESWTVPLEIGKGLQWMDGKTPDGGQTKTPPIILAKRLRESSLLGQGQKEYFVCDPASSASARESVDL